MDAIFSDIEIITLVVSVISVIVALIKIWQKWDIKMADHKEFILQEMAKQKQKSRDNELLIQEHKNSTDLEIANLRKTHETDVKDIYLKIEKSIDRIHIENREDHGKLFLKIEDLSKMVFETCAAFREYKEHDIIRKRT